MTDIFSKQKRSEIMSKIRSKNTRAELILRRASFAKGLRYRIHDKRVHGKPDIIFFKKKIAVFVDGDWWHGRNFESEKEKYSMFWCEKIMQNIKRDQKVNNILREEGWKVLRFWQKDIEKQKGRNIQEFVDKIKSALS
ncbi:MAG: very short patch repair endonuclease [bacterium]|nr:very short patch repair endonuclease [bacterium]